MLVIEVVAAGWSTELDVINALYDAVDAPDWAGCNLNAVIDVLIWDDVIKLERPYTLDIINIQSATASAADFARLLQTSIMKHRFERIGPCGIDAGVVVKIGGHSCGDT